VSAGARTYRLVPVRIPEFAFVNVYGIDVTAERAMNRFPDQNPNPVLRLDRGGRLAYANPASAAIVRQLGVEVGEAVPAAFLALVHAALESGTPFLEVTAGDRLYELKVVEVYEFDFINLYGTDVTAAREVEQAHRENERLLLNILPASIAERLRRGEMVIADRHEEVTVLFADVVDFTRLSGALHPHEVVDVLNAVFSAFDGLADHFGLEKIKTIGDAYMVVGGLAGDDRADHAERVADMALAMVDAVSRLRDGGAPELSIRVGLHLGPTVAGVIGVKRFIYDVWGDTVNVASRMESLGVPGRVHVTEAAARRLEGSFLLEPRGELEVKGKGPMRTWFLVGRRQAAAEVSAARVSRTAAVEADQA
jgi:class 3 adenylate cyclase